MRLSPEMQAWIDRARAVPIEAEAARRGLRLMRQSRTELHGPCPGCGGTDRFFINTRKQLFHCRGCGATGDIIDLMQFIDGSTFKDACASLNWAPPPAGTIIFDRMERQRRDAEHVERMVTISRRVWREATALTGTLGERYLRDVRCIAIDAWPPTLRFHPQLAYGPLSEGRFFPGIVCPVQNRAGQFRGIWRIFLDPTTGNKAQVEEPRLGLGDIAGGGVRLTPVGPEVILGEGIETMLAVLSSAPGRSYLAGLSTSIMRRIELPAQVQSVIFLEENDLPDKNGRRASPDTVQALSARLVSEGRQVRIARPPEGFKDFNDLLMGDLPVQLNNTPESIIADILDQAKGVGDDAAENDKAASNGADPTERETTAELDRLAKLRPIEYDRERRAAAKKLGLNVKTIDDEIKIRHSADTVTAGQGRAFVPPKIEPWPDPVDGAAMLSEVASTIKRYLVMPTGAAETAALWVTHTYCFEIFMITPRLAITSPEKQCGKTTFLELLEYLVAVPLMMSNASPAGIFRVVEMHKPTLLIDEADTFLKENEELRGILNSGYRKGGAVLRTVGDDHEPRLFSTWAPLAIAMIGNLPDTLADRAVACSMRRRKKGERVESFRAGRLKYLKDIVRQIARWAADHEGELRTADPDIPGLENRAADNWQPLVAIADAAGGDWPKCVRDIATAAAAARADQSTKVQLLADIRAAFGDLDRLSSEDLTQRLIKMDERPWSEYRGGKPITQNGLSRLLKQFEVTPDTIRIGERTPRGYYLSAFDDAFSRYLPPLQTATSQQAYSRSDFNDFQSATRQDDVAGSKSQKPYSRSDCCDVSLQPSPSGRTQTSVLETVSDSNISTVPANPLNNLEEYLQEYDERVQMGSRVPQAFPS
jgi:hypothetical protein